MAEFANQTQTLQEMKVEIQSFIEKITRNSRATDKEGLCIISGKLVWSITVQLNLINDDGNSFDAFFLAAILALKNTRLPEVTLVRNKLMINDDKLKYLNVHHIPVSTTFYFMQDLPEVPILDVNGKEERLCKSRLSIAMNAYEDICGMSTLGALNLGGNEESEDLHLPNMNQMALFKCMETALKKTKIITQLVRASWDSKDKNFGLLEIAKKPLRPDAKSQKQFIERLNEELEQNRKSHPSQ
jgi:exosome complex component RRP45